MQKFHKLVEYIDAIIHDDAICLVVDPNLVQAAQTLIDQLVVDPTLPKHNRIQVMQLRDAFISPCITPEASKVSIQKTNKLL